MVTTARRLAPDLHIITRASTWEGGRHLKEARATAVVRPELEGGIEIVRRTLLGLEFSAYDVQRYTDALRQEELGSPSPHGDQMLSDLAQTVGILISLGFRSRRKVRSPVRPWPPRTCGQGPARPSWRSAAIREWSAIRDRQKY
jgi:Trk K+ transport system NAD-binding subunit